MRTFRNDVLRIKRNILGPQHTEDSPTTSKRIDSKFTFNLQNQKSRARLAVSITDPNRRWRHSTCREPRPQIMAYTMARSHNQTIETSRNHRYAWSRHRSVFPVGTSLPYPKAFSTALELSLLKKNEINENYLLALRPETLKKP
jgi:hypothetical protein